MNGMNKLTRVLKRNDFYIGKREAQTMSEAEKVNKKSQDLTHEEYLSLIHI